MTNALWEAAKNYDASKMKTEIESPVNYEMQHGELLVATTMGCDNILLAVNTEGKTLQFCKTTIQATLKQNKRLNFLLKTQEKRVSPLQRQYKWLRQLTVNQNSEVTEPECFYSPRIGLSWHVLHDSNRWMNMLATSGFLTVSSIKKDEKAIWNSVYVNAHCVVWWRFVRR